VVTGGAGFLGSHLCEYLLNRGTEVVCVDNFATGDARNVASLLDHDGFQLVVGDACDPRHIRALAGPVDLVLHLASLASPVFYLRQPLETLRVGATGTAHALELARAKGARFVLASTSEVYGDPLVHPQNESYWGNVNPVGPRSVYDESKRYAEALTMAYHRVYQTPTAIARIFNTYGPKMRLDDGRMIPTFIRQSLSRKPLTVTGDGQQTRSVCYVTDTTRGIMALAESDVSGPVNIGNPEERTVREIAEKVGELTGEPVRVRHVDRPVDDPRRRCPDISLAASLLGWRPRVDMDEGLRRTIDWFAHEMSRQKPGANRGPPRGRSPLPHS
jgi:dTDP-glucose 4,6-dehydratase